MSRTSRSLLPLVIGSLAVVLFDAGCARDTAGPTSPDTPVLARGGKPGGGGGAKDIDPTVDTVKPDSASQDTTLDVLVIGSGFDDGSRAEWLIDEAPVPNNEVRTNRTTYVNSKRLIANITIAADAPTTAYDVEVTSSKGRKGIGIERFMVKEKLEPIPVEVSIQGDDGDGLLSDDAGVYVSEIDKFGNLFLDARTDTGRKICLDFMGQPDAPYEDLPGVDVCDAGWVTTFDENEAGGLQKMGSGGTLRVRLGANWVMGGFNWSLTFGRDCLTGELIQDDLDVVAHPNANTWIVEGSHATLCRLPVKGRPRSQKVGSFVLPHSLVLERVPTP